MKPCRRNRGAALVAALSGSAIVASVLAVLYLAPAPNLTTGPGMPDVVRDEGRYSEDVDAITELKAAGSGPTSGAMAEAEYRRARAVREFSEKYGRVPKYQTPAQRYR